MTKILTFLGSAGIAIAFFGASSLPAFGDGSGTINATVTAGGACLTLSQATVDFGTTPFSTPGASNRVSKQAGYWTNCSGQAETLLARGTDAKNSSGATRWTLIDEDALTNVNDICPAGANKYGLSAQPQTAAGSTALISTADRQISLPTGRALATGASEGLSVKVSMPCAGSAGGAEPESFQYVFTAMS